MKLADDFITHQIYAQYMILPLNGDSLTNNNVKATHRLLRSELTIDHPKLWRFINGLNRCKKSETRSMKYL